MARRSILLADDNKDLRTTLRKALDLEGDYIVHEAHEGDEAISVLLEHDVDVIVLDLEMPGTDGYEALHIIQDEHNGWPDTNIIIMTAHKDVEDWTWAWANGVKYFIPKPLSIDTFLTALREIFQDDENQTTI